LTENEKVLPLHMLVNEPGEVCLSLRRSMDDSVRRDRSYQQHKARLADMECYTLAKIAHDRNIPMSAVKVTTDFADCESTEMFKKQVEESAKKLALEARSIMLSYRPHPDGGEVEKSPTR
jgi:phosphorylase superfamily protein